LYILGKTRPKTHIPCTCKVITVMMKYVCGTLHYMYMQHQGR
jgi:hypothetical protein